MPNFTSEDFTERFKAVRVSFCARAAKKKPSALETSVMSPDPRKVFLAEGAVECSDFT